MSEEAPKNDVAQVPNWVVANLFVDVLKQKYDNFKDVKSLKAVPGLGPGENYATIMLRLHFEVELSDGSIKNTSLMLKIPHDFKMYRELLKKTNMFEIERDAYLNIVPELEQLYCNAGSHVKFCAQAYKIKAPDHYVLLEDLVPRGFKNANRLEGLDMEHTKYVLRKLAQWHAASAKRVESVGAYPEVNIVGPYNDKMKPEFLEIMANLGKVMLKCLPTYEGYENYGEAVRQMQSGFMQEMFKLSKPDPNEFNVLNHGDCWTNNIMFQYDAFGKIKDVFFVDYQLPKYGTVAQDLLYFIITSVKLEIKLRQFDYLIRYYHENLIENLILLKYSKQKMPTLRYLHTLLYKYGFIAYQAWFVCLPPVLLDPSDKSNLNDFVCETKDGNDLKMQMYSNERFREYTKEILPWLYNRGALEI